MTMRGEEQCRLWIEAHVSEAGTDSAQHGQGLKVEEEGGDGRW
jgi:hypothetical protein